MKYSRSSDRSERDGSRLNLNEDKKRREGGTEKGGCENAEKHPDTTKEQIWSGTAQEGERQKYSAVTNHVWRSLQARRRFLTLLLQEGSRAPATTTPERSRGG